MRGVIVFILTCACVLTAVSTWGERHHWMTGQSLKRQMFADQHGRVHMVDETTRLLLFAPDRAAARLVHAVVKNRDAGYLSSRNIVYVADISRMPALVARIFALPRMRRYSYPIALGRKVSDCVAIPRRTGRVSLLSLDRLRLKEIRFAESSDEMASLVNRFGL